MHRPGTYGRTVTIMSWSKIDGKIAEMKKSIKRHYDTMKRQLSNAVFVFKPFSVKQKKVLTWWCDNSPVKDKDGIIADGAIRSGKTLCMSLSFVMWGMARFSHQNFAICGKTIGSLRRNVIFWLKLMLRSRGYQVRERRTDNLLVIKRGDTVNYFYLFGGKDEGSQDLIQGITLAGAFFDEVALMPESFVNQATARCSVDGSKWWFNCNPEGPKHWFKENWIDNIGAGEKQKNLIYLHFTMDDNLSLSEAVKARYRSQFTGLFYQRYILGLWKIAEGLVYPMFDEKKHVVHEAPKGGLYYISVDYGTRNPFSAGLYCINGKVATKIKEVYHDSRREEKRAMEDCQKTDEEYYTMLEELAGDYVIQAVVIDPSAASFKTCIKRHRKFSTRNAHNEVLDGIRNTATMLNVGMLKIHEDCKDTIREFGLYCWNAEAKKDEVVQENDHALDETRYLVQTIMRRYAKGLKWVDDDAKKVS
ncbi:PBSX family phage terminase large subunit [Christensenella intestinihominis]|uniref:PBSX family phage terminase large subunit n=1 Tax=Christensenella intestinihominis TaxID=1851429 RepID=UPI002E26C6CF